MRIITNNTILMKFVPNVVSTVEGEETLYQKIEKWLEAAEDWVCRTFTGNTVLTAVAATTSTDIWRDVASLIAAEAMRNAIPSLDLVLTPNGFGIVSNNNVAPASKERVERLISQMGAQRDHFIDLLIADLCGYEGWNLTEQYKWFTASLLQFPKTCVLATTEGIPEGKQWEAFVRLRERAIPIEDAYAEKWVSPEVMTQLRTALPTGTHDSVYSLAVKVRACVFAELREYKRNHWDLDRITNYIRHNTTLFPSWATSDTAKLYEDPTVFRNKKESSGYFF